MSNRASTKSSLGVLLATAALFAVVFYVLMSLLDVISGSDLTTALRANVDNAVVVASIWTIAMLFLRRRRA
jgi:hypothetical protein